MSGNDTLSNFRVINFKHQGLLARFRIPLLGDTITRTTDFDELFYIDPGNENTLFSQIDLFFPDVNKRFSVKLLRVKFTKESFIKSVGYVIKMADKYFPSTSFAFINEWIQGNVNGGRWKIVERKTKCEQLLLTTNNNDTKVNCNCNSVWILKR